MWIYLDFCESFTTDVKFTQGYYAKNIDSMHPLANGILDALANEQSAFRSLAMVYCENKQYFVIHSTIITLFCSW